MKKTALVIVFAAFFVCGFGLLGIFFQYQGEPRLVDISPPAAPEPSAELDDDSGTAQDDDTDDDSVTSNELGDDSAREEEGFEYDADAALPFAWQSPDEYLAAFYELQDLLDLIAQDQYEEEFFAEEYGDEGYGDGDDPFSNYASVPYGSDNYWAVAGMEFETGGGGMFQ